MSVSTRDNAGRCLHMKGHVKASGSTCKYSNEGGTVIQAEMNHVFNEQVSSKIVIRVKPSQIFNKRVRVRVFLN